MANSSGGNINDSNQEGKPYSFSTWVVSDHDQMNIQNSFEFSNFKSSSSLPISPSQASSPSSYNFSPSVLLGSPLSFSNSNIFSSPTAGAFPGVVSNNEDTKHFDFSFHSQAWPWTGPSFENNSSEELLSVQQGTWTSNTSKKQTVLPTAFIGVKSEGVNSTQNVSQKIASTETNMQNSYSLQSNQIHCNHSSQFIRQQRTSDDGYKWRKYGHKQVKASENPRSYYKCTYPNCLAKKKVETNLDGEITEIVYKGSHNHPKPQSTRGSLLQSFQNRSFTSSEISIQSVDLLFNNSPKDSARVSENSSASFGDDDFDQVSPKDDDTNELEAKRWKGQNEFEGLSVSGSGTVQEPRIIVQTTSDIDILDDGYRWRKYGQKVVKGNSNPRSYYKCTYMGCPVRKHIERASNDLRSVITTYEGKHNHDVPAAHGIGSYRSSSVDSNNKVSPVIKPLVISNRSNHGINFLQSMNLPTTRSQYTHQMLQSPESLRFSGLGSSANPNMNQLQDMGNDFPLAKEGPTDGLLFNSFLD